MNLKSQSVYDIRTSWRNMVSVVIEMKAFKEAIKIIEDKVELHNKLYNDNLTSDIVFANEKTVALNYPL